MQGRRGIALETRRPGAVFLLASGLVLALDQVSKLLVRGAMHPSQSIPVIEGFFHLTYVRNTGASFGLMPGQRSLFIFTSIAMLSAIAIYWWRVRPRGLLIVTSLALVTGGAVGNLIDRVVAGRVTDMFDFLIWPVFNIADIGIVVGAAGLFIWALFAPVDAHEPNHSKPEVEPDACAGESTGHQDAGEVEARDGAV